MLGDKPFIETAGFRIRALHILGGKREHPLDCEYRCEPMSIQPSRARMTGRTPVPAKPLKYSTQIVGKRLMPADFHVPEPICEVFKPGASPGATRSISGCSGLMRMQAAKCLGLISTSWGSISAQADTA